MRATFIKLLASALVICAGTPLAVFAQSAPPVDISPAPPQNDFRTKLSEVGASLQGLNAKIADSLKEVDRLTDPKAAREELEKIQGYVAEALDKVADNGAAAEVGRKAQTFAEDKLARIPGSAFSAEQRAILMNGWSKVKADLDVQITDLSSLRKEFSSALRTMQQRSDYLGELQALDDGNRMLEVVRDLAAQMRATSNTLQDILRRTGQPGT